MEPENRQPEVPTESTVSQPAAPPERKVRGMKPFVIGGSILVLVLVVLGFLVFMPVVSAAQWRSSTIDTVNQNIEDLNRATRERNYLVSKMQPSEQDVEKLISELKKCDQILKDSKNTIKPIGGAPLVDITGEYKKTADARTNILEAYDKLIELNAADLSTTEAQQKVFKMMNNSKEFETSAEARETAKIYSDSASEIDKLGNSKYGTQIDKDFAKELSKMAAAVNLLAEAMDTNSEPKAMQALADTEDAATSLAEFEAKYHDQGIDQQKKMDEAFEQLNKAIKALEF